MKFISEIFDLTGKTAVVTGAAGLLGRKFAEALAMAGAKVAMVDLAIDRLEEASKPLFEQFDGQIILLPCDITKEEQTTEVINKLAEDHGVDILVNSAAIDPKFDMGSVKDGETVGAFTSYSLENWKRSMDVNLTGTFIMTKAVCRHFEEKQSGVVINISSTYGISGPDQRIYESKDRGFQFFKPVDYSVTKAGMIGFTKALAAYYQGKDIRVNALSPGGTQNNNSKEFIENYSYRTILGRMAVPEDYVGAIIFLCSDASAYMTGSNLVVDGGWTAL